MPTDDDGVITLAGFSFGVFGVEGTEGVLECTSELCDELRRLLEDFGVLTGTFFTNFLFGLVAGRIERVCGFFVALLSLGERKLSRQA